MLGFFISPPGVPVHLALLNRAMGILVGWVTAMLLVRRKQADATLDRERVLLSRITETSPAAITVVNRQGQISFANRRAEEVLGVTRGKMTGTTYSAPGWRITDYEGGPFPEEQLPFRRVMDTGQAVFNVQHAIEWPDGRRVLLSINAAPLRNEAGEVDGMVATVEDVTERVRTEEALRLSESRLAEAQRIAHIGSWHWGLAGPITWSDQTYRVYGVSPDTFTPTVESLLSMIHPDDRPAMQAWITVCAAGQEPAELEFRNLRPDGTVRVLSGRGELRYDSQNRPSYMAGTVQDITEHNRAEEALRESEEKFSKAFHSNPAMLVLTTLDGNNVDVNQAYADFLGYAREEILGKSVVDLRIVSVEERQRILELIQRSDGSVRNAEIAVRVRDGSLRHILLSADMTSLGGVPHRLVTLLDITERKQAEEKILTQLQELQQ